MNHNTLLLPILPHQLKAARIIASNRTRGHDQRRRPGEDLGENGNAEADDLGTLAEFVVIASLEIADLIPEDYNLLSRRAHASADFRLGEARYDVKSFKANSGFVYANEAQRNNAAHIVDYLLPCARLTDYIAVYQPIPYVKVVTWDLRDERGAPYRSLPVGSLLPLKSLQDLPCLPPLLCEDPAVRATAKEKAARLTLNFGKYKGRAIGTVSKYYLNWCLSRPEFLSPELLAAVILLLE